MDGSEVDLRAHVEGIGIRLGHQLAKAHGGRANTGSAHVAAELWALRRVRWMGAAATLLHDARGQLPVLPRAIVAQARAELWPAVA